MCSNNLAGQDSSRHRSHGLGPASQSPGFWGGVTQRTIGLGIETQQDVLDSLSPLLWSALAQLSPPRHPHCLLSPLSQNQSHSLVREGWTASELHYGPVQPETTQGHHGRDGIQASDSRLHSISSDGPPFLGPSLGGLDPLAELLRTNSFTAVISPTPQSYPIKRSL